jgi:hypothetical protein
MNLRKSEGYTTPLAVIMVFIIMGLITFQYTAIISEQRFYEHQKQNYTIETLIQRGVVDVISRIMQKPIITPETDVIQYDDGTLNYSISIVDEFILEVRLNFQTRKGYERKATLIFDKQKEIIIEWKEA